LQGLTYAKLEASKAPGLEHVRDFHQFAVMSLAQDLDQDLIIRGFKADSQERPGKMVECIIAGGRETKWRSRFNAQSFEGRTLSASGVMLRAAKHPRSLWLVLSAKDNCGDPSPARKHGGLRMTDGSNLSRG
jgi:hypothetical protein